MKFGGPWSHLFDVASRYVSDPIAPDDVDVDFSSMSHLIQVDSIASAIGRLNDVVAAACTDVHYVCTDSEACWLGFELGLGLGLGLLTLTLTLTLTPTLTLPSRSAVRSASMSRLLLAWLNDASNPDAFPDPIPDPIPNPNPKPNP